MGNSYEKCFVYKCLATVCHGASLESQKFIDVCLECPAFRKWILNKRKRKETNDGKIPN